MHIVEFPAVEFFRHNAYMRRDDICAEFLRQSKDALFPFDFRAHLFRVIEHTTAEISAQCRNFQSFAANRRAHFTYL